MLAKAIFGTLLAGLMLAGPAVAATYKIDAEHGFIQWKVQHLGFSSMVGRFNQFHGTFNYDPKAKDNAQGVSIVVETGSLDSNNALRDKHLRSDAFLNTDKFPTATFNSTAFQRAPDGAGGKLTGNLTMNGHTREVVIDVRRIGEGKDPWGGYRAGFEGTVRFDRREFGIDEDVGPESWMVELEIQIEGVRQ
jgi:polyisoprenoid-binding protein YceI